MRDISQLPAQYQHLERKTDMMDKALKRLLVVTRTYEVEGYDYPPNLQEGISGWFSSRDAAAAEPASFTSHSFADALAKAGRAVYLDYLDFAKDTDATANGDEDEDPEIATMAKAFEAWANCYANVDEAKNKRDASVVENLNQAVQHWLATDFKNVHTLRNKVADSRLKFDTYRHELKGKPEQDPKDEESARILEQLEDEFVSNTADAVSAMEELTENHKLLELIKNFQGFQLAYHKQCVQELQANLQQLNELEL